MKWITFFFFFLALHLQPLGYKILEMLRNKTLYMNYLQRRQVFVAVLKIDLHLNLLYFLLWVNLKSTNMSKALFFQNSPRYIFTQVG